MIPQTFAEWKNCIINDCKVDLTSEFVRERLLIYNNSEHQETQKFAQLYGQQHLLNIIQWYNMILHQQ